MASAEAGLPSLQRGTTLLGMWLVSWWVEQGTLAQVGSASAAFLVLAGAGVLVGAVWTGWRYWVRWLSS
jgi:hypothetical protein